MPDVVAFSCLNTQEAEWLGLWAEASLGYIVSFRPSLAIEWDSKEKREKKRMREWREGWKEGKMWERETAISFKTIKKQTLNPIMFLMMRTANRNIPLKWALLSLIIYLGNTYCGKRSYMWKSEWSYHVWKQMIFMWKAT